MNTYLTCVSEHLDNEDRLGRLSMWRAYGAPSGVALVLNNGPFLRESDALTAYTSPVAYYSIDQFKREFYQISEAMEANEAFIGRLDYDGLMAQVFHMFRLSVLSTKHPGFHEEKEWRIIHSPEYEPSENLKREVEIVHGSPQPVIKLPLKNFPDQGFFGASIPELLDRIIIGPTEHPFPVYEAFVTLLQEAGVEHAGAKVFTSDIPLRQR